MTGRNRFLAPPEAGAGVEEREAKLAVEESILAPLRDRDRELGLGPEGPVMRALEESAARGAADVNSKATFEAVIGGDGALLALMVVDANGAIGPWREIADAARQAVSGIPTRRVGGRGIVARIDVESRWQLPSGRAPGAAVSVLGVPAEKGDGPRSRKVEILKPIPKLELACMDAHGKWSIVPMESAAASGMLCVPMVHVPVLETDLDPTDIGPPRRVVRARVVSERPTDSGRDPQWELAP